MAKKSKALPSLWPPDVEFITTARYSKTVRSKPSVDCTNNSKPRATALSQANVGPCALVRIRKITGSAHPAYGQYGLFTTRQLSPNSFVLPYLGFIHGPQEGDERSDYDISLDREIGIGIDASKMGNEARFINDYRGVDQDGPNAEFRDCWIQVGHASFEQTVGIFVLPSGKSGKNARGIAKGEEILVSYGKGFWSSRKPVE